MTKNHLATIAACAFAGYALWYVNLKPAGSTAVSAQPAQRARDRGLMEWHALVNGQAAELLPLGTSFAAIDNSPYVDPTGPLSFGTLTFDQLLAKQFGTRP